MDREIINQYVQSVTEGSVRPVIRVERGQEHSLQISDNILKDTDFMYPAYTQALRALSGILKSSEKWRRDVQQEHERIKSHPGEFRKNMKLYEYSSNIIAFCGGRGQGKTSVMRSFAEALRKPNFPEEASHAGINLNGMRYVFSLPTIDPSILEDKDSIMAIILSNLFYEAEKQWNNPPNTSDKSEFYRDYETDILNINNPSSPFYTEPGKSVLMRQFKHCIEELRELQQSSRGGTDSLDALYELGDSLDSA